MKLNYQLSNSDFLEYQLYTSSKSKVQNTRRFRFRTLFTIVYIGFGLFSYFINDNAPLALIFAAIAILWYLFYPMYSKWVYKRHFRKHINEHYSNRINTSMEMEILQNSILIKDATSQSSIDATGIKDLIEIKDHFFILSKTDMALIVPKKSIGDIAEFKETVADLGVSYVNALNWRWK